jgi:predicted HTH transcriptional regulator
VRAREQPRETALRLMQIMGLFSERRCWTAEELAQRLTVTQRTVERDLLYLSSAPYYVPFCDDSTCWSVPADWRPRL